MLRPHPLALLLAALLFPAGATAAIAGVWEGPLGVVRIDGTAGTLLVPRPGVSIAEGQPVLEATPLGDSYVVKIRLPFSGCAKRDGWAGGVLMLAMKGNLLSGALSLEEPGCTPRVIGANGGFAIRRVPEDEIEEAIGEARAEVAAIAAAAAASNPAGAGTTPPPPVVKPPKVPRPGVVARKKAVFVARKSGDTRDAERMADEAVAVANQDLRPLGAIERAASTDPGLQKMRRAQAQTVMSDAQNFLSEGRFEEARERFLDAIEKDPTVAEAYNGVGVTFYARNQPADAEAWYRRSLAVDPDFGDAYYNLACLRAMSGKKGEALQLLELAARNGYTTDESLEQDPDLESVRKEPRFVALRKRAAKKKGGAK